MRSRDLRVLRHQVRSAKEYGAELPPQPVQAEAKYQRPQRQQQPRRARRSP